MSLVYDDFETSGNTGIALRGRVLPTGQSWLVDGVGWGQGGPVTDGQGRVLITSANSSSPAIATLPREKANRLRLEFAQSMKREGVNGLDIAIPGNHASGMGDTSYVYRIAVQGDYVALMTNTQVLSQQYGDWRPDSSFEVVVDPDTFVVRLLVDDVQVVRYAPPAADAAAYKARNLVGTTVLFSLVWQSAGEVLLERYETSETFQPEPPNGWQWTVRRVIEQ